MDCHVLHYFVKVVSELAFTCRFVHLPVLFVCVMFTCLAVTYLSRSPVFDTHLLQRSCLTRSLLSYVHLSSTRMFTFILRSFV